MTKDTDNISQAPQAPAEGGVRTPGETGAAASRRGGRGARGEKGDRRRGGGRGGRPERVKSEYDQKTLEVRRVARVVAGGRRFSFAVAIVLGDRKGRVGVGTGKAGDVAGAVSKAEKAAKKTMVTVRTTKSHSIAHAISAKYSSARVALQPSPNRGLVAGSAMRTVLELAGVTDVTAKIHSGSKNKLNIARAVVKALATLRTKSAPKTTEKATEDTSSEEVQKKADKGPKNTKE